MSSFTIKSYKSTLINSNMYIVCCNNHGIIFDPHISQEALEYIKNNSLYVDYIILTHEHYDHISGVNWFKELFKCNVICSEECAYAIQRPELNLSKYFDVLNQLLPKGDKLRASKNVELYSCNADIVFQNKLNLKWQGHMVDFILIPGHSRGSICILFDNKYLFSGDSLLKDYSTVTRLRGGDRKIYKEQTLELFKSLAPETIVYPGHYEMFVLGDRIERKGLL